MLKIVSAAVFSAAMMMASAAVNAADTKIGYVSLPYVYQSIPQSKAAEEKVKKALSSKEKAVEKMQNEGIALQKALEDPNLPNDQRAKKQREIQLLQTELNVKISEIREEQQKIISKEKLEIDKKIQAAIDSVAKEKGLSAVFRSEVLLYSAEPTVDISEAVVSAVSKSK